ncbi:MAG: VCBS repeat-containing protein [Candidatus Microthrix sp.]|nr:FG-GAP and VCBS repeat-containing protein [Candidatus Microthrix sp.]MBK7020113.1 VCBS repeat-containing protein [Candidatus Microthrix sp.]
MATGDVTGDGAADLVVGTPGDWVRSQRSDGSPSSRVGTNASVLTQSGALPGGAEANDAVGASVAVGDLDEDGYGDVIVGAPDESFGSSTGAGMVGIAFGAEGGVSGSGSIAQGTAPLTGYGAEWGDHFWRPPGDP